MQLNQRNKQSCLSRVSLICCQAEHAPDPVLLAMQGAQERSRSNPLLAQPAMLPSGNESLTGRSRSSDAMQMDHIIPLERQKTGIVRACRLLTLAVDTSTECCTPLYSAAFIACWFA